MLSIKEKTGELFQRALLRNDYFHNSIEVIRQQQTKGKYQQ